MRARATRIFQPPESAAHVAVHRLLRESRARPGFRALWLRARSRRALRSAPARDQNLRSAARARRPAPDRRARCSSRCSSLATFDTGPAPSIVSSTTARPDISPTSWLKYPIDHPAIDRDLPPIGLFFAGDEAKDGGLARAVRADEPHLFAAIDRRRCLEEEDLVAVLLADEVEANHWVGRFIAPDEEGVRCRARRESQLLKHTCYLAMDRRCQKPSNSSKRIA